MLDYTPYCMAATARWHWPVFVRNTLLRTTHRLLAVPTTGLVMASIVMVYTVMAYIVMASVVMAYIVMADDASVAACNHDD